MSILTIYQQNIASGRIASDAAQLAVVERLQQLQCDLYVGETGHGRWWQSLLAKKKQAGIYLWGTVGSGKTYLMDIFFQSLAIERKRRIHFHHFMQQIHAHLQKIQGQQNPLTIIAKHWAKQVRVLCLDEFLVQDIGDAMILEKLLEGLFVHGVCLVTTANTKPDDLYANGLQRARFLPAIELLKQKTQVVQIKVLQDYRLRTLQQRGIYFTPLDARSHQQMQMMFDLYAHHGGQKQQSIRVAKREIATIEVAEKVVWFDFDVICHVPRSTSDYVEIAQHYPVVLISHVPHIQSHENDRIVYFIHLVDIFYDNKIELILSAAVPLHEIYLVGQHYPAFQRTLSRLQEMQSTEYLYPS